MSNITGDMTQEEVDDALKRDLAARIGSSSDTNPIRLTTAQATRLLELLGGAPEGEDPRALSAQTSEGPAVGAHAAASGEAPHKGIEATDDEDDSGEPSKGGKRKPARR
jgi:hypothetical protein